MVQRFKTVVATRVTGAVASPTDENTVDSRVVQNSADIYNLSFPRMVHAAAFSAVNSADYVPRIDLANGRLSWLEAPATDPTAVVRAAVELPDGATVDSFTLYGYLEHTASIVAATWKKYSLSTNLVVDIATVSKTGSTGAVSGSAAGLAEVITNDAVFYFVEVTLTNDTAFSSAQLVGVKFDD